MDTDPGILCFQHCSSKVFCFELPAKCPICGSHLSTAHYMLLPFRYILKYSSLYDLFMINWTDKTVTNTEPHFDCKTPIWFQELVK
jgi:hypothetical protein